MARSVPPMGPYVDVGLDDVFGCIVNLSQSDFVEFQRRLSDCAYKESDGAEKIAKSNIAIAEVMRDFVTAAWRDVSGFAYEDGTPILMGVEVWSTQDLDLLADNGMLLHFWQVGQHLLGLQGEARGKCGASPPTSCQNETATPAQSKQGLSMDASKMASRSGFQEPNSKDDGAPGLSLGRIQTSAKLSGCTPTPMGS